MPVALITGASSGIGLELARIFARQGYDLVLVARSEDKLRALAAELDVHARVVVADLARPGAAASVVEQAGPVDVLVNNAGFGLWGPFVQTDLSKELEMIQLNIAALTEMTKRVLPPMLKHRSGRILNVASVAGFQPGPLMAVYYATKAYVLHFSEAIANELKGTGITVTALCPGATQSNFGAVAQAQTSRLFQQKLPAAAEVAEAGYRALMAGEPVYVHGWKNRFLLLGTRLLPRNLVTQVARSIQEKA